MMPSAHGHRSRLPAVFRLLFIHKDSPPNPIMSPPRKDTGGRPTLPPIRDVFRDELRSTPRPRPESPSLTLARLQVDDDGPQISYPRTEPRPRTFTSSSTSGTRPYSSSIPPMPPSYAEHPRGMPAYPAHVPYTYPPTAHHPSSSTSLQYSHEAQERTPTARYPSQQLLPYDPRYATSDNHRSYSQHRNDQAQLGSSYRYYDPPGSSGSLTHSHSMDHSLASGSKYECSYCGKGFNRPSSLKIHLNSHTGEKPFQCPVEGCGRSFSVLSNMRRHARVHSKDPSGEELNDVNASSSRNSSSPRLSAADWTHHRRNSSASTSSSGSRRGHSVSSDSGDDLDLPPRSDKRSRPYDYGK
ncbi:hypothetical protein PM082_001651 [Marasmius tenuissimus]|nr:hypothetical protein PM082_001651 [Marasmius tenuissimus]